MSRGPSLDALRCAFRRGTTGRINHCSVAIVLVFFVAVLVLRVGVIRIFKKTLAIFTLHKDISRRGLLSRKLLRCLLRV